MRALVLSGFGVAAGGAYGVTVVHGPVGPTAPLLCVVGGLAAAAEGIAAFRKTHWLATTRFFTKRWSCSIILLM